MSTSPRTTRNHRRYSSEFKRARVRDFENGTFSVAQLSRLYSINRTSLYNWIEKFSTLPKATAIIMEVPNSQTHRIERLEKRLAAAEQALGQKQLQLELANAKLAILEEQGVDVKKKVFSMKPSNGYDKKDLL